MLVDLGSLEGELIAVDGDPVEPVAAGKFGLAVAQRADVKVTVPPGRGAYPVLARPEGQSSRTGIVLVSGRAPIEQIAIAGDMTGAVSDIALEGAARGAARPPAPGRPTAS